MKRAPATNLGTYSYDDSRQRDLRVNIFKQRATQRVAAEGRREQKRLSAGGASSGARYVTSHVSQHGSLFTTTRPATATATASYRELLLRLLAQAGWSVPNGQAVASIVLFFFNEDGGAGRMPSTFAARWSVER